MPTSNKTDEFETSKIVKNRPLAEGTWYEWYDWLISHNPKSVKKSASNVKEKKLKHFETETLKFYIPEKIAGNFDDKYIDFKSAGDEKLSVEQYLENIKI